jgi:Zn-dependent M32 family carboxypeptidase
MMLKRGKEEIIYLLNKCIEKFQLETGKSVIQNTNRKNYEALAIQLSEISNLLSTTHETHGHAIYELDPQLNKANYPFRK